MIPAERRRLILAEIRNRGVVSLRPMAEQLEVSEVTLRRDLNALAGEGLLDRSRGGATLRYALAREPSYLEKAGEAQAEKAEIARAAAGLVKPGDSIILGPGSTTLALARELRSVADLTVVTNSMLVVEALSTTSNAEVVVTAGTLRRSIHALVGPSTEQSLRFLRADKAFLSCNGVSAEFGATTPEILVAAADKALAAAAKDVIVIADHTKVGSVALCQTLAIDEIDLLITDPQAPKDEIDALRAAGLEVVLATESDGLSSASD
ncbi:MAG TPA: DeoR/GlpR family DNA-binding transcription regulator [Acidimicrobiia bacterium]|nr:DeoR/GlpR family DNA-binding transcription regulator [Acidimicrobiia bacterium]